MKCRPPPPRGRAPGRPASVRRPASRTRSTERNREEDERGKREERRSRRVSKERRGRRLAQRTAVPCAPSKRRKGTRPPIYLRSATMQEEREVPCLTPTVCKQSFTSILFQGRCGGTAPPAPSTAPKPSPQKHAGAPAGAATCHSSSDGRALERNGAACPPACRRLATRPRHTTTTCDADAHMAARAGCTENTHTRTHATRAHSRTWARHPPQPRRAVPRRMKAVRASWQGGPRGQAHCPAGGPR